MGVKLTQAITFLTKYNSGDQGEKNEMGGMCSTYGGTGEVRMGFRLGNLWEITHLEDAGVDGRIILKLIFRKWDVDTDWIVLAQRKDMWRALVNAVMNLSVPQNVGNFLTSREPVSFPRWTLPWSK